MTGLDNIHPETAGFEVSGHSVVEGFLHAGSNLELTNHVGVATRKVAGAIVAIFDERRNFDTLRAHTFKPVDRLVAGRPS